MIFAVRGAVDKVNMDDVLGTLREVVDGWLGIGNGAARSSMAFTRGLFTSSRAQARSSLETKLFPHRVLRVPE